MRLRKEADQERGKVKHVLVTGRPGVGKTTVIRRVLERLRVDAGGFFTEEIREHGRRVGFVIVTTDGKRTLLARVNFRSLHQVGKYGVNVRGIEEVAVPALLKAVDSKPLIVIDEIAKMELSSPLFKDAVLRCLRSPKPLLGVIQASPLPFLDRIRVRADVEVIEVNLSNREYLPQEIIERLRRVLGGR